jgi:lysozyme family protein
MIRDYFPTALAFVWRPDIDGQPYHVSPNDPGGATNWGVTYQTWAGWQRLHKQPASLPVFHALDKDAFQPLYRALFWNACRCSSLGAVGVMVFDVAVNCGPGHGAGFLQTVLGVDVDNQIGPVTLGAFANKDPATVVRALCGPTGRVRFSAEESSDLRCNQGHRRNRGTRMGSSVCAQRSRGNRHAASCDSLPRCTDRRWADHQPG